MNDPTFKYFLMPSVLILKAVAVSLDSKDISIRFMEVRRKIDLL